jgi:lipopolysaccharide/colanic/teichoic acid biosynthesis glycosyltransferase
MTGLAQVNGNIALSWNERIEYDVDYVTNYSILMDLKILIKTILVVIYGEEKFKNPKKMEDKN